MEEKGKNERSKLQELQKLIIDTKVYVNNRDDKKGKVTLKIPVYDDVSLEASLSLNENELRLLIEDLEKHKSAISELTEDDTDSVDDNQSKHTIEDQEDEQSISTDSSNFHDASSDEIDKVQQQINKLYSHLYLGPISTRIDNLKPTTFKQSLNFDTNQNVFDWALKNGNNSQEFQFNEKNQILEAMNAAIESLDSSWIKGSRDEKKTILKEIHNLFKNETSKEKEMLLVELFRKVAASHRYKGFSLFKQDKTASLKAFEASLEMPKDNITPKKT